MTTPACASCGGHHINIDGDECIIELAAQLRALREVVDGLGSRCPDPHNHGCTCASCEAAGVAMSGEVDAGAPKALAGRWCRLPQSTTVACGVCSKPAVYRLANGRGGYTMAAVCEACAPSRGVLEPDQQAEPAAVISKTETTAPTSAPAQGVVCTFPDPACPVHRAIPAPAAPAAGDGVERCGQIHALTAVLCDRPIGHAHGHGGKSGNGSIVSWLSDTQVDSCGAAPSPPPPSETPAPAKPQCPAYLERVDVQWRCQFNTDHSGKHRWPDGARDVEQSDVDEAAAEAMAAAPERPTVGAVGHDEASAAVSGLCRRSEGDYDGSPMQIIDRYIRGRREAERCDAGAIDAGRIARLSLIDAMSKLRAELAEERARATHVEADTTRICVEKDAMAADLATAHADVARLREELAAVSEQLGAEIADRVHWQNEAAQPSGAVRRWSTWGAEDRNAVLKSMRLGWPSNVLVHAAIAVLEEAAATTGEQPDQRKDNDHGK